jgi:tetratricopeptide (TPR) repeat protein
MQTLARVAPGSIWRHQAAAEAFESQGSYDLAIREYRTVLQLGPGRPGIHFRLGRTLLKRSEQSHSSEDANDAAKEFEGELELDPTNANAAYELADMHRDAGQFEQAAQLFEQALKYYPDFEDAHLGLAAALIAQQKMQDALPHLKKAIALNPDNEVSWYRLSQVQMALGSQEEQRKAFAEFQRLRTERSSQQEAARELFSRSEVTKQKLDSAAPQ